MICTVIIRNFNTRNCYMLLVTMIATVGTRLLRLLQH